MNKINILYMNKNYTKESKVACMECQSSCQSACKTSCTIGNQTCKKKEEKIRVGAKK